MGTFTDLITLKVGDSNARSYASSGKRFTPEVGVLQHLSATSRDKLLPVRAFELIERGIRVTLSESFLCSNK